MKIQFLGSGAAEGIPAFFCNCEVCKEAYELGGRQQRTRCGALIDDTLKLDFPPDTFHHILEYKLDFENLKSVLITHTHEDHFAIHDIFYRSAGFAQVDPDSEPVTVYGNGSVEKQVERYRKMRGTDLVRAHRLNAFEPTSIEGYTVTALLAQHMTDEECFFYLIEKEGKKILYANDTGIFPEATFEFLAGQQIDLVAADCTMGKKDTTSGHMGIPANRTVRERLLASGAAKEDCVFVLNHFSHNGYLTYDQLVREAPEFVVSYDGLIMHA